MKPAALLVTCALTSLLIPAGYPAQTAEENSAPAPAEENSPASDHPEEEINPGDFGSDQPLEREDLPERGQIRIGGDTLHFTPQAHWYEYTGGTVFPRPGTYSVRIRYHSPVMVRMQFRIGDQRLRTALPDSLDTRDFYIGELQVERRGENIVSLYTPLMDTKFTIDEIRLIPATGNDPLAQRDDGSVLLPAAEAVTWSETMRYEPQPEKNCLGFWTDEKDWAEWEFDITKPGSFEVALTQGCGEEGGSEILIESNGQKIPFTVKATGGFQNWETIKAGVIEFKEPGRYRLALKPQTKKGAAVMDVRAVNLTPAS